MHNYIIIGAGISGVSFARFLSLSGENNFLILEAGKEAGGLCRTRNVNGHWLDIGGGHFLSSRYPDVYSFIFDHIPKSEFNYFDRISRVRVRGHVIDYPIENNLWQLPRDLMTLFLDSVIQNGEAQGKRCPGNFRDWIHWRLGERIADDYLIPYNQKIWGVPIEELATDWLHKLPRLNTAEIVTTCRTGKALKGRVPSHEGFYYPKRGGFQLIFDAILRALPEGSLLLSEPVHRLYKNGDHWVVNERFKAKKVVNTAPWPSLLDGLDVPSDIQKEFGYLKNNAIVVALYENRLSTDAHWVYEPAKEVPHHREFLNSNFSEASAPNGFYTETNSQRWNPCADALFEFKNDYAYPIPVHGKTTAVRKILEWADKSRLYGLGRWGQWDYYNADECVFEAKKLSRRLAQNL
jgi:protoporphyrinogen oxidase